MPLTQYEIDANSRTQMKGDTQTALRDLLIAAIAVNDWFYESIFASIPELPPLKKEIGEVVPKCCSHAKDIKAMSDFESSQVAGIIARFRRQFGDAQTVRLLDIAEQAVRQMMFSPNPSATLPFDRGYSQTIGAAYRWSFAKVVATKIPKPLAGQVVMPSFAFVVDHSGAFEREIWKRGYDLVTSKITKNLLPEAMQTISAGLNNKLSWGEIAAELQGKYTVSKGHWVRLVRSEMGQAAHRASIRQYATVPQLKAKWNTSRMGETCEICLGLDGKVFEMADVPGLPHPNCRCVVVPTFK